MRYKFIYLFFAAGYFLAGCSKKCEKTANYVFDLNMYITPNVPRIRLGDTLKLLLQIKFKSFRLDNGEMVDVSSTSLSTSGIDFVTYRKVNDSVIIDGNNFRIIPIKGSFKPFNQVNIRASYIKTADAFEFEAYVIPTQRGLANFANYRAEGWMNGRCILNDFSPIVGSSENNHQLIVDLYSPIERLLWDNNYYVWVE